MREDQFQKLEALQEKLVDSVLTEADPANWSGAGKLPVELTRDERGDQYWCKRNAAATLTLLNKTLSIANHWQGRLLGPSEDEDDSSEMERDIASAEKRAMALLDKAEKRKILKVVK